VTNTAAMARCYNEKNEIQPQQQSKQTMTVV